MTEETIFVHKPFLSLGKIFQNVPKYFLCKNCNPSEKCHRPPSQQPPLQVEILLSPSPFENLVSLF